MVRPGSICPQRAIGSHNRAEGRSCRTQNHSPTLRLWLLRRPCLLCRQAMRSPCRYRRSRYNGLHQRNCGVFDRSRRDGRIVWTRATPAGVPHSSNHLRQARLIVAADSGNGSQYQVGCDGYSKSYRRGSAADGACNFRPSATRLHRLSSRFKRSSSLICESTIRVSRFNPSIRFGRLSLSKSLLKL
jgi:hypothetical protein